MTRTAPHRLVAVLAAAIALFGAGLVSQRSTSHPTISHPLGKLAPTPGPSSDGYIAGKRAYLGALEQSKPNAPAAGLVSFTRLLRPAEADRALVGANVSAVFVDFPAGRPEAVAVHRSIGGALQMRATQLIDATKAEMKALEAKKDPASKPLIDERRRQLDGTRPDCACIYAAVVERSTVVRLVYLAKSRDVRLVDVPDPLTDDLSGWQLTPILPGKRAA
jgi:hypothetical protein